MSHMSNGRAIHATSVVNHTFIVIIQSDNVK